MTNQPHSQRSFADHEEAVQTARHMVAAARKIEAFVPAEADVNGFAKLLDDLALNSDG